MKKKIRIRVILAIILFLCVGLEIGCNRIDNDEDMITITEIHNFRTILYIIDIVEGNTPQVSYRPDTKETIIYDKTTDTATYGYVNSEGEEDMAIVDNFPDSVLNWEIDGVIVSSGMSTSRINIIISGEIYIIENNYHLKLTSIDK